MHVLDLRDAAAGRLPPLAVPDALAPAVAATWRGRMVNEHGSARVFAALAEQFAAIGATAEAAECRRFADEERDHGAACGAVASAAGGEARAEVERGRAMPDHADTTPRTAVLRNVIAVCCLAETVAVALIGAERLEMPEGPLRDLLTRIWADEIGHSRFGWTYLATAWPALTDDERAAVDAYLPLALGHLEAHELAHIPANRWPPEGAAYGLCDGADARDLFYGCVTDVIVPQLEAHGLGAALAWRDRRAP